jgi:hypothetical protein
MLEEMPLRPAPILGHPLDDALRDVVLMRFLARRILPALVWQRYLTQFGCSQISEFMRRLEYRYDASAATSFRIELLRRLPELRTTFDSSLVTRDVLTQPAGAFAQTIGAAIPKAALLALSDEEFLMAVEHTLDRFAVNVREVEAEAINRLFRNLGVPYRYGFVPDDENWTPEGMHLPDDPDEDPEAYENLGPTGRDEFYRLLDPDIEERVIRPALRALADDRLVTAASDYQAGLALMLSLDDKALKNAVLDFGRSVLNALTALARATNVEVERAMPSVVFKALINAGVLPVESRNVMLATASFRNIIEHRDEHTTAPRRETAEAAMGAASVALAYIASFLPPAASANSTSDFRTAVQSAPADNDIPF